MQNIIKFNNQEWEVSSNNLIFINIFETNQLSKFTFLGDFDFKFADQNLTLEQTRDYSLELYKKVIECKIKPRIIFWLREYGDEISSREATLEWEKSHEFVANSGIDFEFSEGELSVNSKFHPLYFENLQPSTTI